MLWKNGLHGPCCKNISLLRHIFSDERDNFNTHEHFLNGETQGREIEKNDQIHPYTTVDHNQTVN